MNKILSGTMIILLMSCGASKKVSKSEAITNINFEVIQQGTLHGNGKEGIDKSERLIKDAKTWKNLLEKMGTVNRLPEKLLNTKIDFSKENIIAIFMPVLGSGGSSVEIESISTTDKNVIVKAYYKTQGGPAIAVMNQPYIIAKIPVQEKEVVFMVK